MTDMELAKEQHREIMLKINEVSSGLRALFIVPVLMLYMIGVDLAFWFDRITIALWAAMNVMVAAPILVIACALMIRRSRT